MLEEKRRRGAFPKTLCPPKQALMSAIRSGFHVAIPFSSFPPHPEPQVDRLFYGLRTFLGTIAILRNCSGG